MKAIKKAVLWIVSGLAAIYLTLYYPLMAVGLCGPVMACADDPILDAMLFGLGVTLASMALGWCAEVVAVTVMFGLYRTLSKIIDKFMLARTIWMSKA